MLGDRKPWKERVERDTPIIQQAIDAAVAEKCGALVAALRIYANKDEWYGSPWKLTFDSSHMDGDGWETAARALAAHRGGNGKD
jgi:hypothetical protein